MSSSAVSRISHLLLRYGGVCLVYLAALVRASTLYAGLPQQRLALGLLTLYGLLLLLTIWLADAPGVPRIPGAWRLIYLLAQTAIVAALQSMPPRLEVLALLFVPLSLQAVIYYGRPLGFAWIVLFIAALTPAVVGKFDSTFVGLVMAAVYGGACLLMGYNADLISRADAGRRANERLIRELQTAHRELQDYAAQLEAFTASQTRRRLARELHDSAGQTIFGMNLASQTAAVLLQRDPARVPDQLDRLQALALSALREIQALTDQLRPRALAEGGLPAALRRLAAERAGRDGLTVRVEVSGERELPAAAAEGLCHIVQEALNNVVKHAKASRVHLCIAWNEPWLECVVEDNGRGLEAGPTREGGGNGLKNLQARTESMKGTMTIRPGESGGTRLELRVPLVP